MANDRFKLHTYDIDGTDGKIVPYTTLAYTHTISEAGTCVAGLPDHEPAGFVTEDNIAAGRRHVEVWRDEAVRTFGGRIWNVDAVSDELITIEARGYLYLLDKKLLLPDSTFTPITDPGFMQWKDEDGWNIAWRIIEYAQSLRDMGFSRGMPGTSGKPAVGLFEWSWANRETCLSAISRLATLPGKSFYYLIDENRVWKTYTKPGPQTSVFALTGGPDGNIIKLRVPKSADETAREIVVYGDGTGEDMHWGHTLLDEEADVWGRLMQPIDRPDVRSDSTLADLADLAAERHANVRVAGYAEVKVGPDAPYDEAAWEAFGPGESIHVSYDRGGYIQVDDWWRVASKTVTIGEDDSIKHSLLFDSQWDNQV